VADDAEAQLKAIEAKLKESADKEGLHCWSSNPVPQALLQVAAFPRAALNMHAVARIS
jgi:hypothetical protein